ncbi:polysaccharide deacetylase family protein [bacterium]|nr:polysaccharide deacetylase family protein [bacterium]
MNLSSDRPALLYHKVSPSWEVGVTRVSPPDFYRQMKRLAEAGWSTILPSEACPCGSRDRRITPSSPDQVQHTSDSDSSTKQFLLIFDDGYKCIYKYALPVLREFGFRATVFIPSAYLGKTNDWDHQLLGRRFDHLDRDMLLSLIKEGWEIGSHTVSHIDLLQAGREHQADEIFNSRLKLKELTGQEVNWISFPFCRYDRKILEIAINAGYSGGVIPVQHDSVTAPDGFCLLKADAVYRWDSGSSVNRLLERGNGYKLSGRLRSAANRLSYGTVLWKRLFSNANGRTPLAMSE